MYFINNLQAKYYQQIYGIYVFVYTFRQYGHLSYLTEVIFVFTKLNQTCAKIYFHLVKLVLLLFEKFLKNSDDYSNTFYLVTLGEETDCGRKECETKKIISYIFPHMTFIYYKNIQIYCINIFLIFNNKIHIGF